MDKDTIKLLAQIGAMKLMLGRLYSLVYVTAKLTPEQISELHKKVLEGLPAQSLADSKDPALSDLLSAEIQVEIAAMLQGIERDHGIHP